MNKVQVCVRCRPTLRHEVNNNHVILKDHKVIISINEIKEFYFDEIYDQQSSQEIIFENQIKPLLDGCLNGYNATVFACKQ